ncbi:hypothetical protein [Maribellus maritimus]|uniref:hypothetical protein n=1 Tax=Maribellus maritimus TaxID=2870838 RepID=UPI001EEC4A78|nr:hypothetical protein [Maribellus maritimus]MCG6191392.1 hypothetical protein [Maribellus maritimus]
MIYQLYLRLIIPSLSGILAKRTKPTLNQILPKSLAALPAPTQTQNKYCGKIENNEYKT